MREMLGIAGQHLVSLPSGETRRPNWIASDGEDLDRLLEHPDLRILADREDPDPDDYLGNRWKVTVKEGHKLNPNKIELHYSQHTHDAWTDFSRLRDEFRLPDLSLQVGLPGTLQDPMFAFRRKNTLRTLVNGFRYRKPFEIALQKQVETIWNDPEIGSPGKDKTKEIMWHIEVPAETGGMDKMPKGVQPVTNKLIAPILARGIVRQVAGFPEGSNVIIHTCKGDWERRAFSNSSTALIASLVRSIISQWPQGRTLDGIHFPFAAGDIAPSLDESHYKALSGLSDILPEHTRFIAGFVHEGLTQDEHFRVRDLIERNLGRRVDIAGACGFGRVKRGVARRLAKMSVALAA
jgi:hypothetical protein